MAQKHANVFKNADKMGSQPIVVAKTILKAANARNPKTRYATGAGAKPIIFFSKILPDKVMDALVLAAYGRG